MASIEAYDPSFLSQPDAHNIFQWLSHEENIAWQQETFQIFGRSQAVPRLTAWFGNEGVGYRYTGLDHNGIGWPADLQMLRDQVSARLDQTFNFVILNRYRSGADHMGWHRDAEKGICPLIASLSLGSLRTFKIQAEAESAPESYELENGSLLAFNGFLRHQLPKRKRQVGERINLTFRTIGTDDALSDTKYA